MIEVDDKAADELDANANANANANGEPEADQWITRHDDGTTTVRLRHPITFANQITTELTIRPIKAKYLRRLPSDEIDATLMLAARLSGQPTQIIDELEGADMVAVLTLIGDFMPAGPSSGSEPSDT